MKCVLKDLLPAGRNVQVEYRCNAPKHCDEEDMIFGFACKRHGLIFQYPDEGGWYRIRFRSNEHSNAQ